MPHTELVDGGPAFVEVRVVNDGPVIIAPPWVWNGVAVREQGLTLPLRLEAFEDHYWRQYGQAVWRCNSGVRYGLWSDNTWIWPVEVRLWPGEKALSWLDLTWQYDLPAGTYRVSWSGPLFRTAVAPRGFHLSGALDATPSSAPIEFRIGAAGKRDAEVLSKADYRPGTRTPDSGDRCSWIRRLEPAALLDTAYEPWWDYFMIAGQVLQGGVAGDWRSFHPWAEALLKEWAEQPFGIKNHPMRTRLKLAADVYQLRSQAWHQPAAWPGLRQRVVELLARSADHEWAACLARYAAWAEVPEIEPGKDWRYADLVAALENQQRVAREIPARWGYPWFRLPPDQRPGGAAAKPEP